MICGNIKLLNLMLTTLFTTEIQICFAIIFLNPRNIQIELRDNLTHLNIPRYRTTKLLRCIKYQGMKVWNSIPREIR